MTLFLLALRPHSENHSPGLTNAVLPPLVDAKGTPNVTAQGLFSGCAHCATTS